MRRAARVPYCALEEAPELGYGETDARNLLIRADNLMGLKALCPHYAGAVKCVFIDPPYNTRQDFEHYRDNLQHTQWLEMMYPRLELLNELLAEDGSIWVTLDDHEAHYLKVLMDEIFGRKNFIGNFIWEKKRKPSFLGSQIGKITDHVICFAKSKNSCRPFQHDAVSKDETYPLYNPGNARVEIVFPPKSILFSGMPDGDYPPREYVNKTSAVKLLTSLTVSDRWNANEIRLEGEWRYTQKTLDEQIASGEHYVVKSKQFRPRRAISGREQRKKIHNLLSRCHYGMATNEDAAKEILTLFGKKSFDYPKPEKLVSFIIGVATQPGDLVLDSFLGSGTTAAVAHKMGRRYIGLEMENTAETHCVPRLRAVVDGEQGGISELVKWKGGGGFRFLRLGGAVFNEDDSVNPDLTFADLAAHIWFLETHRPFAPQKKQSPFLGEHRDVGYALLYNGILGDKSVGGGNKVTTKTLATIRRAVPKGFSGKIIVYAHGCLFRAARMDDENIEFRQIPYDCKKG